MATGRTHSHGMPATKKADSARVHHRLQSETYLTRHGMLEPGAVIAQIVVEEAIVQQRF